MEESWINGQEVTPTNFTFFPHGVCKIVVKSSKSEQYKRIASVQCSMKGLIFDIDSVSCIFNHFKEMMKNVCFAGSFQFYA